MIPLTNEQKAERAKKRDNASTDRATRAAKQASNREAANKKYLARVEARKAQLAEAKLHTRLYCELD